MPAGPPKFVTVPGGGSGGIAAVPSDTIVNRQHGFTLKVPEGWEPAATPAFVNSLLGDTVPAIVARVLSGKGDLIQVEISPLNGKDLKTHVDGLIAVAKKLEGAQEFELTDTKLANRPAIRRVYSTDRTGERKTMSYYIARQHKCIVLACQASKARFDQAKPAFEEAVKGFLITP